MFGWKKATVEVPGERKRNLETVSLTYVRWLARYGRFSDDLKECVEAFPDPEEAEQFAKALRDAFKLIRHTSGTTVTVETRRQ